MKLIDLTCPSCGGKMQVNPELETVTCNFCGNQMMVDKEIVEQKITGGFDFGYEQQQGIKKALEESENEKRIIKNLCDNQKIIRFFSTIGFMISFSIVMFSCVLYFITGGKPNIPIILFTIVLLIELSKNFITVILLENRKIYIPLQITNIVLYITYILLFIFVDKTPAFTSIMLITLIDLHGIISTIWLELTKHILKTNPEINIKEISVKHFGDTKKTSIIFCAATVFIVTLIICLMQN